MGFNNLQPASGPFYLAPGGRMGVRVWFGDPGDDQGAQWIMANPLRGEPPTALQVTDHRKILDYSIGVIIINGPPEYSYDPNSSYYQYGVTVTNLGDAGVRFNVQGGGNT